MGLLTFMFYRKQEKSVLASRKYGEKQVNPEELDKPLLADKLSKTEKNEKRNMKIGIVGNGRKPLIKILFDSDEENKRL